MTPTVHLIIALIVAAGSIALFAAVFRTGGDR